MWDDCKLAVYIILAAICALIWVVSGIISFLMVLIGLWILIFGGLIIVGFLPFFKFMVCCVLSIGLTVIFFNLSVRLTSKCDRLINESIAKSKSSIFSSLRGNNFNNEKTI